MSDPIPAPDGLRPTPPTPPGPEPTPSVESLATSVRRLKVWVWILTAIVVKGALIPLTFAGLMLFSIGMAESGIDRESPSTVSVDDTREQIKDAFGSDLDRAEVREVTQSFGYVPFPYSVMAKSSGMKSVYMEYQLKGSDVVVAGLTGDMPMTGSTGPAGMIPTKGSLASRMTLPQFKRLLAAYAAETKAPLGTVRRYNDASPLASGRVGSETTVTIGSKDYAAKELWSATEGMLVKGDEVTDELEMRFERTAHVFREDPVTGEFTSLGTEPSFAE